MTTDLVNHPAHYTWHPSGIEVIEITRGTGFSVGNAIKYILRHENKDNPVQDLNKAEWYLTDCIKHGIPFSINQDSAEAFDRFLLWETLNGSGLQADVVHILHLIRDGRLEPARRALLTYIDAVA